MTEEKLLEMYQDIASEWRDPDYWCECGTCDGRGNVDDASGTSVQCPDCDGDGWREL